MSNHTQEDALPKVPATKRVAKKAAAKKNATTKVAAKAAVETAEKVAKKAPAKKPAVKKVAAKKVAKASVAPTDSVIVSAPPEVLATASKPAAARATRAKKVATEAPADAPAETLASKAPESQPPEAQAPRRIGRVPGGGPTVAREAPAPPPASTPFPQAQNPAPESTAAPIRENHAPAQGRDENAPQREGQEPRESRSKRRREKRKRRKNERQGQDGGPPPQSQQNHQNRRRHEGGGHGQAPFPQGNDADDRRPALLSGPSIEANGLLELAPKGFGFLRIPGKNFEQARDDIFVTPETIRKFNLRLGQWIHGLYQTGPRGPQLVEVTQVNDLPPEEAAKLPHFDELKAINPTRRISFETKPERFTTRVVDIMAPVGRGQRGLIVSPPRSGKTTLLLHMAEAIREKYDEAIHLMVVLVDERPEEVTEFRRALPGVEIYASSNDEQARSHTRIAEIAIERAKRLVEAGRDVFLIMDSITRLARAYNGNMNNRGRGTASGGLTIGALEVPRRLFAAARNTRGGGSLTIMATALIQTNSRADEAIYMEFKGTGNMELVLDRKIAENYIYPAVDIFKSGTRREELLLADHMLHKIHLIRRGLSGHRPAEAMERLLFFLKKFPNNPQMLLEIKG
jgi:transcription termination factor Rho